MKQIASIGKPLTKNQELVFGALSGTEEPQSAYTLLDKLRADGLRAPLQIYRALEKLIDLGLVHRLESLNAFVACSHPTCADHTTVVFAICDTCGLVDEVADERLASNLKEVADDHRFVLKQSIVELRGTCNDCAILPVNPQ
ncbi:MAG: transcriptional repressor [Alphaproteobacteria bacterium]|nr:transcriptional repressor [Alphaproteobacteria bacterium]